MICYLSRNYKGVNNAANKAKTDIEYIMEQCGYRNVGLKQTRYTNAVIAFILTLSGVLKSVFCLHKGWQWQTPPTVICVPENSETYFPEPVRLQ